MQHTESATYNHIMQVLLANPRGFCAGVDRAIEIVERAIQLHGAPIYVRHEVVHNKFVVDDLRKKGAVFVEDLDEVPAGATLIFSAHGVSQAVRRDAESRGLRVFDATCPLVTKVHVEVAKMRREERAKRPSNVVSGAIRAVIQAMSPARVLANLTELRDGHSSMQFACRDYDHMTDEDLRSALEDAMSLIERGD